MRKILLRWLGLSLIPVFFLGSAWAQSTPDTGGYGPRMMWWDGGSTMMFFGPLFMIVTLAALVAAIVFLVRWQSGAQMPPAKTALDILKERFARGEIDKTEFDERRRVLAE